MNAPNRTIDSGARKYSSGEIPEHFRDLAFAYLEASERLCREMESGSWSPNYCRGQVVMWLAFHATELFLKGCIRVASLGQSKNLHSLGELLNAFSFHFPSLPFEPPFGPEPVRADPEAFDWAIQVDATLHQQLRYPVDTAGKPWSGEKSFTAELFILELQGLRADFDRIASVVFEK